MSIIRATTRIITHVRMLPLTLAIAATTFAIVPSLAQGPSEHAWVAPERPAHRSNSVPATAEAIQRGHDLFHRDCEQCHGKLGHGDGPQSGSLNPHPADLASERVQSQLDGALFWKISEGRGMMPKATLGESEKWSVIDYIRTLAAKP